MDWVLFFDGECGVCSSSVMWFANRDPNKRISYAPLQGKLAADLGLSDHASISDGTLVLRNQATGRIYKYSDAVIHALIALGGIWRVAGIFKWVPKFIRDRLYLFVSNRRYFISHRLGVCRLSDVDLSDRLLD